MTIRKPFRLFRRFGSPLVFCALVGLLGCGGSQGTVTGTVKYKDAPLPSGTVTFIGKDGKVASGTIDPNGHYTVAKVPVGPATITVRTPPPVSNQMGQDVPHVSGQAEVKPVQIPEKYSDAEQSGLSYTVQPGAQEHPIELK